MYIIKNAFRCIGRSKGRNILIGIIALVIAVSACIGLSIRQAAESARTSALEGMCVTATISYNRAGMMNQLGGNQGKGDLSGGFDRNRFADLMGGADSLTLAEYQTYATAESVQDFYYTLTAYLNGSDALLPVGEEDSDSGTLDGTISSGSVSEAFPGMNGMMGGMSDMLSSGDFSVIGFSGDSAMSDFLDGTASILEGGVMFDEGTEELVCVISEELALYNGISVGDTIVLTNPTLESECYTLTVSGIYTSTANNDTSMSLFGKSQDPANRIYMSANALQRIIDASEVFADDAADDDESTSSITATLSATYVFADADAYHAFEEEARALGLDDSYTVSSSDLTAFENSLTPLNTLSTMAGWFLLVVLLIGGAVLAVLNIFQIRERKYEVGVLTAMGMKKWKVAVQFMCEILAVTMLAVFIGALIGAVSSVPVTNALLKEQTESQSNQQSQSEQNFGRPGNMGGMAGGNMSSTVPDDIGGAPNGLLGGALNGAADYVTEVHSAMNLTVVVQLLGIGLLLTLVTSLASVLFIMRYDPLKILANRD